MRAHRGLELSKEAEVRGLMKMLGYQTDFIDLIVQRHADQGMMDNLLYELLAYANRAGMTPASRIILGREVVS